MTSESFLDAFCRSATLDKIRIPDLVPTVFTDETRGMVYHALVIGESLSLQRSPAYAAIIHPGSTVKRILLAMTLSHQVTQHGFRELDIAAEWTGFDYGRVVVFVTGLAQIGDAHQCSYPDCSGKPCIRRVFP